MRAPKIVPATALFVVVFCAVSASAQAVHTLQGRVIAPNGLQPQTPVRVTLTYGGRRHYETFTDLSGRFFFSGLAQGTYEIIADGDDQTFEKNTVKADVSAARSGPHS